MDNFHIFQGSGFLRPLSLLLIFSGIFLNAAIVSGVLVYGWCPLFTATAITFFVNAFLHMNSQPCVAYYMEMGASVCFSAEFLGAVCPLKFTGNENSVYVSVIVIFVASVGLCCLPQDTLSASVYGVPWGPCFCCLVPYGLFPYRFSGVFFTFFCIFGTREPSLFKNSVPYIPGVSVLSGDWLSCSSEVWDLSWSAVALLFGVYLPYFFLYRLFFHMCLFVVITVCSKQEWAVYPFFRIFPIKPPHVFFFVVLFFFIQFNRSFMPFLNCLSISPCLTWSQWSESPSPYISLIWWYIYLISVLLYFFWDPLFCILLIFF